MSTDAVRWLAGGLLGLTGSATGIALCWWQRPAGASPTDHTREPAWASCAGQRS